MTFINNLELEYYFLPYRLRRCTYPNFRVCTWCRRGLFPLTLQWPTPCRQPRLRLVFLCRIEYRDHRLRIVASIHTEFLRTGRNWTQNIGLPESHENLDKPVIKEGFCRGYWQYSCKNCYIFNKLIFMRYFQKYLNWPPDGDCWLKIYYGGEYELDLV